MIATLFTNIMLRSALKIPNKNKLFRSQRSVGKFFDKMPLSITPFTLAPLSISCCAISGPNKDQ